MEIEKNKNFNLTVIAKPTNSCNLNCAYCYVNSDLKNFDFMDEKTLENMLVKISGQNKESGYTTIIWHGGEPTLVGLDFYKKVVEIQKTIDHKFNNSMQSNGTLLTEEILDFFQENKFDIGLSLDGTRETHDKNRYYPDKTSCFDNILNTINECQKRDIGGGVICVVNKNTINKLAEIYDFFKNNSINPKFNQQFPSGNALDCDLGITPLEFGNAMIKLFDRWFYDKNEPIISISPFEEIIENLGAFNNKELPVNYPIGCNFRNNCAYSFISVGPSGDVFPCGRFESEDGFYMGNINSDEMDKILSSEVRSVFIKRTEGVEYCKSCEYLKICNSGCPDNAYLFDKNILKKDAFCVAYKMMFKHIENAIKKELEVSKNG